MSSKAMRRKPSICQGLHHISIKLKEITRITGKKISTKNILGVFRPSGLFQNMRWLTSSVCVDSVWGKRQQSTNGVRIRYNNEIKDKKPESVDEKTAKWEMFPTCTMT
jgi:hypothetical protein